MNLTKYEQETVINSNNGERTATIYTADPVVMRKLDNMVERFPDEYKLIKENDISKTYECPKKFVTFRSPKKLTEEQRAKALETLGKINAQRG